MQHRFFVAFAILLISINSYGYPMPALSRKTVVEKFIASENGFAERWQVFANNRIFASFPKKYTDKQILDEFAAVRATRDALYYENPGEQPLFSNPDYERSQVLLTGGFNKAPHLIAFEYNYSHPSYNSSNIFLNNHRFLALEGPQQPDHVGNFKRLLINYDVKKVVRLTNDIEHGVFKSENYWQDAVKEHNDHKVLVYSLPEEEQSKPYSFVYYAIDNWADNSSINPEFLLDFVQKVRKEYIPGEIIAVHCSAGVGRTGTFIAAFLLLDDIDRQLKNGTNKQDLQISIEEVVLKLSIQRAYLVGEPEQYLTLHKMVNSYLQS